MNAKGRDAKLRLPLVALTNEHAGSDGDIFSHCFKLMGIGRLVGTRTWGGVIGIWPRHPLVDGSETTQPEFSFWFDDVGWAVENYGTDPEIEVDNAPQDAAAQKRPAAGDGARDGVADAGGDAAAQAALRPAAGARAWPAAAAAGTGVVKLKRGRGRAYVGTASWRGLR